MQELRDLVDRVIKIDASIHANVERYLRRSKLVTIWLPFACGLAAAFSLWINVWLLRQ